MFPYKQPSGLFKTLMALEILLFLKIKTVLSPGPLNEHPICPFLLTGENVDTKPTSIGNILAKYYQVNNSFFATYMVIM